jgi:hypothetical protein
MEKTYLKNMEIISQPPYHGAVGPKRRMVWRLTLTATHPLRTTIDDDFPPYDATFGP